MNNDKFKIYKNKTRELIVNHILELADNLSNNNTLTITEVRTFLTGTIYNDLAKWITKTSNWKRLDINKNGSLSRNELEILIIEYLNLNNIECQLSLVDKPIISTKVINKPSILQNVNKPTTNIDNKSNTIFRHEIIDKQILSMDNITRNISSNDISSIENSSSSTITTPNKTPREDESTSIELSTTTIINNFEFNIDNRCPIQDKYIFSPRDKYDTNEHLPNIHSNPLNKITLPNSINDDDVNIPDFNNIDNSPKKMSINTSEDLEQQIPTNNYTEKSTYNIRDKCSKYISVLCVLVMLGFIGYGLWNIPIPNKSHPSTNIANNGINITNYDSNITNYDSNITNNVSNIHNNDSNYTIKSNSSTLIPSICNISSPNITYIGDWYYIKNCSNTCVDGNYQTFHRYYYMNSNNTRCEQYIDANCRFSNEKNSYYNSFTNYNYDFITQNLLEYNFDRMVITNNTLNHLCTINNMIYNKSIIYDVNLYNTIIHKEIGKCYPLNNEMDEEMGFYNQCLLY